MQIHTALNSITQRRWSEAVKNPLSATILPQTPTRLTRQGSIVVKIRCPASLKQSLKAIANDRDCFKGSVNAFIRDILRSRYHRPDIPEPNPDEPATERLTLRLTPDEFDAFKRYAKAWRMPLWRALWNLAAKPYTVADRPTHVPHMSHTKEEVRKRNDLYVCPEGDASKPTNGLAERLWRVYGMALSVANSVVTCYETDAILAAVELRERRNGAIYNPAGFVLYLLKNGYAQRFAEAKKAHQAPDAMAQKVKEAVERLGFTVTEIDGRPALETPNGYLILPPDPDRAKDLALRFALPAKSDSDTPNEADRQPDNEPKATDVPIDVPNEPDSEPDDLTDSLDEPTEAKPTEGDQTDAEADHAEADPFECYPFAAPSKLSPKPRDRRDRAERAAEIVAEQWAYQSRPQRRCPRCGRESKDLLKRYERCYPLTDAELERWDGVEVCFGDPASCYDSLKKQEIAALKQCLGIDDLTEPKLPSSFAPTAQSHSSSPFAPTETPNRIGNAIADILQVFERGDKRQCPL